MDLGGTRKIVEVTGTVASVVFHNGENGYSVLRVATPEDTVTVVGCFPGIACGEEISVSGPLMTHPAYGQQIKAETADRKMPRTRKEIYEYLAFGAVKGVGPTTAAAIVTKFGDKTFEIMENEPERLAEVKGISPRRAQAISGEFIRNNGLRRLMELLALDGIKPLLAIKLYRAYGEEAMDAVKENPYILTHEYFGADFYEADALAARLGFDDDCPQRMEAAVLFELRHNLGNGHVFLPENKLGLAVCQLVGAEDEPIMDAIQMLIEGGYIVRDDIAGLSAIYLSSMYEAETYIADRISKMATEMAVCPRNTDAIIDRIGESFHIEYDGLQRQAIHMAAESNIMALTGGPGTGKTTTVRGILAMLDEMKLDCVLAAPTGRAAKRMNELTGREAFTIHRLLGAGYGGEDEETVFEKDADNPIDADVIILDESSMIDITLMRALLDALRPCARLILVGDADQLPSVGPGNVFSDIIRSGIVPVVRLEEIFRQARESLIVRNAHMINRGMIPNLSERHDDFFFMHRSNEEKTADTIVELCSKRLPEKLGISPSDIQVLSPCRRNDAGTVELNRRLQAALNPPDPSKNEKEYGEFVFREGDRIMQIRNNYDIIWKKTEDGTEYTGTGLFNGDIGKILSIDKTREIMVIDYEDKIASYPFEMLYELEPAYAMTVHKSQGSEYKVVVLAIEDSVPALQTRGVLYTAVTRAREMLIVVGHGDTVKKMTRDDKRQRRYSGLKIRLSEYPG